MIHGTGLKPEPERSARLDEKPADLWREACPTRSRAAIVLVSAASCVCNEGLLLDCDQMSWMAHGGHGVAGIVTVAVTKGHAPE
jgi:hypothetical protein